VVWVWLFVCLLGPRLVLAIWWPTGGGDSAVYATVANNILLNQCVSLSPPAGGDCSPHWGGNQLPGYPAFLAGVWTISHNHVAALIVQSALISAAVIWCAYCVSKLTNRAVAVASALIVGLSPLTLAWSRFLLTDTLSVAATLCVVAEVFRAWHYGRVRVLSLAAALAAAFFLRYSNFLLLLLLVPLLWRQRPALTVALALALVPAGAWWLRSIDAGLGWHPPSGAMPDGGRAPAGYIAWGNGWMTDQYQYSGWFNPVPARRYSEITLPPQAFAVNGGRVTTLLANMAGYDGAELPPEIDDAFRAISQRQWRLVPLRIWNMWFAPYYSSGWPVSLRPPPDQTPWELARKNPVPAAVKVGTALYRVALLPIALLMAWWTTGWRRTLLLAGLGYAAVQSIVHASFGFIDTRYLLGPGAILELAVAVVLLGYLSRRFIRVRSQATRISDT